MASNFTFLSYNSKYQTFADSCIEAERAFGTSYKAVAVLTRSALQTAVEWIYNEEGISKRIDLTLKNLIKNSEFSGILEQSILTKLFYIVELGNDAAHENKVVSKEEAMHSLESLFEFVQWIDHKYGAKYETRKFNKSLLVTEAKKEFDIDFIKNEITNKDKKYEELKTQINVLTEEVKKAKSVNYQNKIYDSSIHREDDVYKNYVDINKYGLKKKNKSRVKLKTALIIISIALVVFLTYYSYSNNSLSNINKDDSSNPNTKELVGVLHKESAQKLAQEPTQEPAQEPTQKLTKEQAQEPTQKPVQEPTQKPAQKLAQEPTQKPTQKPAQETTQKLTQEPAQKSAQETTQKPAQKPTKEQAQETTQKPVQQPVQEPTQKATQKPAQEPAIQITTIKPNGLSYSKMAENIFSLKWDLVNGATSYVVYSKLNYDNSFKVYCVAETNSVDQITVIGSGDNYFYVVARDSDGNVSEPSNKLNVVVNSLSEQKAFNVQVKQHSANSYTICWDKMYGANQYYVFIKTVSRGDTTFSKFWWGTASSIDFRVDQGEQDEFYIVGADSRGKISQPSDIVNINN